jgi:ATP synthase A1 C subunit
MSVARYSYINAKIRARNAELLSEEQWNALLGARDMLAALRVLDGTGYADLVRDFGADTTAHQIERALQEDFNQVFQEITNDTPEAIHHMLIWIQRKYQKENIKTLIRLRATESNRAMAERLLIPISPFTMETLLTLYEASDLRILASNIPDPFFKKLLEEITPAYEETDDLMVLEHTLDTTVLEHLYKEAAGLSGIDQDRTIALVGVEIDLINLMTSLRSHILGLSHERAQELLLPVEYELTLDLARNAIEVQSLEEAVEILQTSRYVKLVKNAWEAYELYQSLRVFEQVFHKYLRKTSRENMLGDPFHFGVILGYLNLKWYETMNLKALMHGKADHLDPNLIRRTLIL